MTQLRFWVRVWRMTYRSLLFYCISSICIHNFLFGLFPAIAEAAMLVIAQPHKLCSTKSVDSIEESFS